MVLKHIAWNEKSPALAGLQIDDKPLFFRRGLFFLAAEGCDRDIF